MSGEVFFFVVVSGRHASSRKRSPAAIPSPHPLSSLSACVTPAWKKRLMSNRLFRRAKQQDLRTDETRSDPIGTEGAISVAHVPGAQLAVPPVRNRRTLRNATEEYNSSDSERSWRSFEYTGLSALSALSVLSLSLFFFCSWC